MPFLLDTNVISDLMSQHSRVEARLAAQAPAARTLTCAIVYGEVRHGIERLAPGRRRTELDRQAGLYFALIRPVDVPLAAGDHYASMKIACKRVGVALNDNDLWIARTAVALGATLVTRDKDFARVSGLTAEDWSA